jgi:hypothetical protein
VLITSNTIVLSPTSCKSICVTYDYNKRLDIRAISGCLYIYIYTTYPQLLTPTTNNGHSRQLTTSRNIKSGRTTSAVLG